MDKYLQEIQNAVQKAGIEGALTEAAVKQFHGVITQCDEQGREIDRLEESLKKTEHERDKIATQRDNMQKQILIHTEREDTLTEREKAICRLECKAEHMEERVKDHKEMFTTVFRNSVLRKEVMTPGTAAFDQYNNKQDLFPDKSTVEEEET